MRCVQIDAAGAVVDVLPQPVRVTDCALVLVSGTEAVNPFALTVEEAGLIAGAIGAVWALAWGVRQLMRIGDQPEDKEQ